VITAAIIFLLALFASLGFTPVARRLALRLGAIDQAGARKIHGRPVPRLGGLAVVGAFFLALSLLAAFDQGTRDLVSANRDLTAALLLGGLVIAALGLHDDLHGASPGTKLLVEFAVASLIYAADCRVDLVALPFLEPIALGWLDFPVTLLWIVGVTNALNLIDGLDGLAAGVAAVAAAATGLLAFVSGNPLVVLLAAALAGAALGFLRHNFNPASIFLGDTGSLFLGFMLGALSLKVHHESTAAVGLLASVLVLGLPLVDTTLAVVRRALRGAPLFRADREHLHHRLLAIGLSHRGAVLVLYAASLLLSAAAVLLSLGGEVLDAAVLASLTIACPAALWWVGILRTPQLDSLKETRRRNLALRAVVRHTSGRLRGVTDWKELWPEVRQAADRLGAVGVELHLPAGEGGQQVVSHVAGAATEDLLCTRSPLAQEEGSGCLELRWRDRATLDRDTEIAVEMLCGEVTTALGRIQRRRSLERPTPEASRVERSQTA